MSSRKLVRKHKEIGDFFARIEVMVVARYLFYPVS